MRGYVAVVAADRRQSRVIMNYVRAFLMETPMLAKMVTKENVEDIELDNSVGIEVATCSYRTIRGRTVIAGLCDEAAFWSDERSANPDVEVIAALKPAMSTIPGSMLLIASSPYARRGVVWTNFQRHYGKAGSPCVARQHADDERDRSPICHRRRHAGGPGECGSRIRCRIPKRHREFHHARGN
jgi:hypothetical protein